MKKQIKLFEFQKDLLVFIVSVLIFGLWYFLGVKNIQPKTEIKAKEYKKFSFVTRGVSGKEWQKQLREKIIELSGADPEIPPVSLLGREEKEDKGGYHEERVKLLFSQDKIVLCHLLTPKSSFLGKNNKTPAVIFFPGNGEGIIELLEEPLAGGSYYQQAGAKFLAENGFITLVCEPWAFWSSSSWQGQRPAAINEYLLKGASIMGVYLDQGRAEYSFLESLENVDRKKIGMAGVSFGGAVAFYTAAIDTRVKASFVSGFLTTYEESYFKHIQAPETIIPGVYEYADIPDIAGLIAPRSVMFDNGESDNSLAMSGESGERLINERIRPIFQLFGAGNQVRINKTNLGHVLDKEACLNYFLQAFNE